MNIFSKETLDIINDSAKKAYKYLHTYVGSNHLFLSTFSFLSLNKDSSRYGKTYEKLKGILNEYDITGKKFEESFLLLYPRGMDDDGVSDYNIARDSDFNAIVGNLKNRAKGENREMQVEDLIVELFADKSYALANVLSELTGSEMTADEIRKKVIAAFKIAASSTIKEFKKMPWMTNINEWVKEHPQTVIGVDREIDSLEMALAGRSIKNAVLTGPAGTGKSTIVYELAQRINAGTVPEFLKDKVIYSIDSGALVAGARYRGDMEERIMNTITVAKKNPQAILFIDECHVFLNLGSGTEGAGGAGDLIKPAITRGELQIIMATTNDEYTKYIAADNAFKRRFHNILIQEPSEKDMEKILEGILPKTSEYFSKEIQTDLLKAVIKLAKKYTLDEANPAKSINMLELACAYSRVFEENKKTVDIADVIESIKLKYDLYISNDKYSDTKKELHKVLLGQDKALDKVCTDLKVVDKNLCDPERPMFSMLLAGPTGKLPCPYREQSL